MAGTIPSRGEVWRAQLPAPERARPVVLVSRGEAYAVRALVTVALVTTRERRIRSHVRIGPNEGLPHPSDMNCDLLETIEKSSLVDRIGALSASKLAELDEALKFALGIE